MELYAIHVDSARERRVNRALVPIVLFSHTPEAG
jgi:hypothetical protein